MKSKFQKAYFGDEREFIKVYLPCNAKIDEINNWSHLNLGYIPQISVSLDDKGVHIVFELKNKSHAVWFKLTWG